MKRVFNCQLSTVNCQFLLILLCLPLLFLNIKDSHDWGDDFAQYLIQARNIIEHRPQTDNGLVFDEQTGEYALKAYPVGFPLMVAGVWEISGPSIKSFSILISFFTFAFAVLIFIYLSRFLKIPPLLSLLFVLAVMYNFIILDFKKNILSDIPFGVFFLLSILVFTIYDLRFTNEEGVPLNRKWRWAILTGILFGLTISIRGIGIVLFAALAIKMFGQIIRWKQRSSSQVSNFKFQISVFAVGFLTYFLLNSVFYPMSSGSFFEFYQRAFQGENSWAMIQANAVYYYEVMKYFFNQGGGIWLHSSNVTKYIMVYGLMLGILFTVFGLLNRKSKFVNRKFQFDDMVFVLYFIILFTYPYQAGGFRFWIPVIPFLLKYINVAISASLGFMRLEKRSANFIMVALLAIVCLQNMDGIKAVINSEKSIEDGPQKQSSLNMLDFVKKILPSDAIIAFVKPRALSFYSDKKTAFAVRTLTPEQNYEAMRTMNVHYYLLGKNDPQLNDKPLKNVIAVYADKVKVFWQNDDFILYNSL
jgi:hypothetical protein